MEMRLIWQIKRRGQKEMAFCQHLSAACLVFSTGNNKSENAYLGYQSLEESRKKFMAGVFGTDPHVFSYSRTGLHYPYRTGGKAGLQPDGNGAVQGIRDRDQSKACQSLHSVSQWQHVRISENTSNR